MREASEMSWPPSAEALPPPICLFSAFWVLIFQLQSASPQLAAYVLTYPPPLPQLTPGCWRVGATSAGRASFCRLRKRQDL